MQVEFFSWTKFIYVNEKLEKFSNSMDEKWKTDSEEFFISNGQMEQIMKVYQLQTHVDVGLYNRASSTLGLLVNNLFPYK